MLYFFPQGLAADAEEFGGIRATPLGRAQGCADGIGLGALDGIVHRRHRRGFANRSRRRAAADVGRQLVDGHRLAPAEKNRTLDDVAQLAHIAGPGIHLEKVDYLVTETLDFAPTIGGELAQEHIREQRDVLAAFPQGRQVDGDGVDAEVEVLSKPSLADFLLEGTHRRRNDPRIDIDRPVGTESFNLSLLQHPQELDLEGQRQLPNLIKEQGATTGRLEAADASFAGSGERALLVAEELGLDQGFGQRSAAHAHIGPFPCRCHSRRAR